MALKHIKGATISKSHWTVWEGAGSNSDSSLFSWDPSLQLFPLSFDSLFNYSSSACILISSVFLILNGFENNCLWNGTSSHPIFLSNPHCHNQFLVEIIEEKSRERRKKPKASVGKCLHVGGRKEKSVSKSKKKRLKGRGSWMLQCGGWEAWREGLGG